MFVEQSKEILRKHGACAGEKSGIFRKGMAYMAAPCICRAVDGVPPIVIGYQNLISYPKLKRALDTPQVMPWASVNVGTWGANGPIIRVSPGKSFLLFENSRRRLSTSYTADLSDPSGKDGLVDHHSGEFR